MSKPARLKTQGISEDENDDFNDEDNDGSNDDDSGNGDDGGNDAQDSDQTDSDDDENPSFTLKDYEEEEQDKEYGLRDTDMTNAKQGGEDQHNVSHESGFEQEEDDGHVTLTTVHDKTEDVNEIASLMNTSTIPPLPPPINPSSHLITTPQQQTPDSTTTTTTNPTMTLLEIPNFASLFQFEQRVSALETKMSGFNQTSQFAKVVSSILGIVDQYLASKMKEAVDVAVRL
ncbi:hypothetical protein Tco_0043066 [Tanacetum coccineum]